MTTVLKYITALTVVGLFSLFQQWTDPYHALIVASVGIALWIATLLGKRRMARNTSRRIRTRHGDGALRSIVLGITASVVWIVGAYGASYVCHYVPILERLCLDTDRVEFELALTVLEEAKNYSDAADRIRERLKDRLSDSWAEVLRTRLYADLIHASRDQDGGKARLLLEEARTLAQSYGMDSTSAEALLRQLGLLAQLDSLTHSANERRAKWTRFHFDTLVTWGDSLERSPQAQRDQYLKALDFAKQHQLDATLVEAKISKVDALIAASQPQDLSAGTMAKINRVSFDQYPPLIFVDLSVIGPNSLPVANLVAKDFVVAVGEKHVTPIHVATVNPPAKPLKVVLLFDRSASTAGSAVESAKLGATVLLDRLQGSAAFKTYAFGTTVTLVHDWQTDFYAAKTAIAGLQAEGNTAMLKALETALNTLDGQPSPKAIVMFTDGRDTVGGQEVHELIARCQKQQVSVSIVGLATKDLDDQLLKELAERSGGHFVTAARETELAQRFEQLANGLRLPRYRLAIPWSDTPQPLRIRIGGRNALELSESPAVASRNSGSAM